MTYVLVHGGWHGAWCWERVTPLLEEAGEKVYTPVLTGMGERADLAAPEVDVDTHVGDVLRLLEERDLRDVVLVGHSYSGFVITGVADRAPGRIAHLVYLDAIVPREGRSLADVMPPLNLILRPWARRHGDGWLVAPPLPLVEKFVTDPGDRRRVREMVTPQPIRTFEQPFRYRSPDAVERLPRTYVHCTGSGRLADTARRFRPAMRPPKETGWHHRSIHTRHNAMMTAPSALSEILLDLDGDR